MAAPKWVRNILVSIKLFKKKPTLWQVFCEQILNESWLVLVQNMLHKYVLRCHPFQLSHSHKNLISSGFNNLITPFMHKFILIF